MSNMWLEHVKKTYKEMKSRNSNTKLKDALKQAKKTYVRPTAWQREIWRESN